MERRAAPVRTCVGCRERAPASELLRVVAVEHGPDQVGDTDRFGLVPDPARRRPGRGAHLHPDLACLARAERRHAFGRALRIAGVLDPGPLHEYLGAVHGTDQSELGTAVGGRVSPTRRAR